MHVRTVHGENLHPIAITTEVRIHGCRKSAPTTRPFTHLANMLHLLKFMWSIPHD